MEFQSPLTPFRPQWSEISAQTSVMIAEDEPLLAEYMASVARSNGLKVKIAGSALEFEEGLKRDAPDAIIIDLAMPGRDGVELMRFLAQVGYRGPLLIVSACDTKVIETSLMLGREMGLNIAAAAQKPISAELLVEMLGQALHELA